jgi:hypothetical protein
MDRLVSIDVDMIAKIIGLPTDGEKPEQYLYDKTKEKALEEEMKKTSKAGRGVQRNHN